MLKGPTSVATAFASGRFSDGVSTVSGYVHNAGAGDAYDWRGARVVVKATAGTFVFVPRNSPRGFTVTSDESAAHWSSSARHAWRPT